MNMYRATRVPGGSYYVHPTTWEDEAATGIVTGAASAAGWAVGAGISGLANLARNTKDRRLALAIKALEDASDADDYDRLLTLATDFTRRYPQIADGHAALAEALHEKGQYDAALQAVDRAAQGGLDDTQVHLMRAVICDDADMAGKAIQEFTYVANSRTAYEYPELRTTCILSRAMILMRLKDYGQALRDANEAINIMPDEATYMVRGHIYRSMGDLDKCLDDYTRAVQLLPDQPGIRETRAEVYEELGRLEEAAADRAEAARISAAAEAQPAEVPQQPAGRAPRDTRLGNNPLATPALICAFIVPLLGLILGLIALVQINKTGEGGHGKAVAAVAISIIWGLLGLIAIASSN